MKDMDDFVDLIRKATMSVDMITNVMKVSVDYLEARMSAEVAMAEICSILEKGITNGKN